jgi:hypothetical protein
MWATKIKKEDSKVKDKVKEDKVKASSKKRTEVSSEGSDNDAPKAKVSKG